MAQTITLGATAVPVGTRVFLIDGVPGNSVGFELIVGRDASWLPAGKMFDLMLEIAIAGGAFQHWMTFGVGGSPATDRQGNPTTVWTCKGEWPGENDGTGQNRRRVLRATDLRITLDVVRAFTINSLSLRTV